MREEKYTPWRARCRRDQYGGRFHTGPNPVRRYAISRQHGIWRKGICGKRRR